MIRFQTSSFSQLTNNELYAILRLRAEVFVVEQACAYLDADGKDQDCFHVLGFDGEQLAAYARIVPPGLSFASPAIGRVVSAKAFRGLGYGKLLMAYAMSECLRLYPETPITISAQHYLEKFYTELGFVTQSDIYLEDEIPHIEMQYRPA